MKLKTLALASLTVTAGLGALSAQAQSSVTIYGRMDLYGERITGPASYSTTRIDSGSQTGSRVGFRGAEDLGGGMNAIFTLEMGINADSGTLGQGGRAFGRQSFLGLQSPTAGQLTLGRQYPVLDDLAWSTGDVFAEGFNGSSTFAQGTFVGKYNMTAASPMLATNSFVKPTAATGEFNTSFTAIGARYDNSIRYETPKFNGFSAAASYGLSEQSVAPKSLGNSYGFNLRYAAGPVGLGYGFHGTVGSKGVFNPATATYTAGMDTMMLKENYFAASYDFGAAKFLGNLHLVDADVIKTKSINLGVLIPFGVQDVRFGIINRTSNMGEVGAVRQYAAAYRYNLSKRTNLYAGYARIVNRGDANAGSRYFPSYNFLAPVAGGTYNSFTVGVRHDF